MRSEGAPESATGRAGEADRRRPQDEPPDASQGPVVTWFEGEREPSAKQVPQPGAQDAGRRVPGSGQARASREAAAMPFEDEPGPGAVGTREPGRQEQSGPRVRSGRQETGGRASSVEEDAPPGSAMRSGVRGAAAWSGGEPEVGAGRGGAGRETAAGERSGVWRGAEEAGRVPDGRGPGAVGEREAGRDLLGGEQGGEARHARPWSGPGGGRALEGRALEGRARPFTPPSTLTGREREIARLVARGLTNRGIADELVISPATVARHVTNILTKLGYSSRAQIAAWVVETLSAED